MAAAAGLCRLHIVSGEHFPREHQVLSRHRALLPMPERRFASAFVGKAGVGSRGGLMRQLWGCL
jgi:hypothetical protein